MHPHGRKNHGHHGRKDHGHQPRHRARH
jgi:hypothetical protein